METKEQRQRERLELLHREAALHESEKNFAALFAASPAPFLILKPDSPRFTIVEVNDAYLSATMRTRDDLIGRGVFEAFPDNPDDATIAGVSILRASLERVLAGGPPDRLPNLRYDIVRPDGTFEQRWWSPVNSAVLDANGQVQAIIHNANDVTAEYRAEQMLRENEERQAFLLKLSDALRPLADPLAIQSETSRVLGEHLGVNRALYTEIEAGDEHSLIERDYTAGVSSFAGRYRPDDFGVELMREARAGRTFLVADTATDPRLSDAERAAYVGINIAAHIAVPLVNGSRLTALFVVMQAQPRAWTAAEVSLVEETAQRTWAAVVRARAEEALRRSEEKYRTLFDTIDEGFCVVELVFDPAGRVNDLIIRELNQAFERQTGLKDAGGCLISSMLPNLERYWLDMYQQVADTGEPVRTENYMLDKGRWFRAHYSRVGAAGSRFVAVVFEDITERKRAEEERESLLVQLREADRMKDEFLAILAHELRNPLASIRSGLQLMKVARNNESAVEQSRAIMERQLGQLVRLVDDLLDVSRISRGKIDLRKERMELTEVIATALEACEPIVEQHGHELTVTLPGEPAHVDADKTRLAQALCNLLNNAAKYTEKGGRIWLTVERSGSDAVLSVKDTGIGIPAPMLSKVFDLFTQVDQSLEKAHGGLGIGLTLVKQLIEMHGGRIEAKSEGQGRGSEFIVRLPLVPSPIAPHEAEENGEPAGPRASRRILVVDDNEDIASALSMLLEYMGNEVCTAHDGLEGVEAAAAFRPDLILMDIGMPKLNGYDACRRIREQPWSKTAIIVALSGWGQEEDKQRSQEAGFTSHLVKPVAPAALEKLLADLQPRPI